MSTYYEYNNEYNIIYNNHDNEFFLKFKSI